MPRPPDVLPRSPGALQAPAPTRFAHRVEEWPGADRLAEVLEPVARPLAAGRLGGLLRDRLLGHALHPSLTDVPIGFWSAVTLLDVRGHREDRDAATLLQGVGVLAAGATAVTGVAEWAVTRGADRRVGSVHAAGNTVGLALHAVSWRARRGGRHRLGVATALLGNLAVGTSAFLGGHLATSRKVGSAGIDAP